MADLHGAQNGREAAEMEATRHDWSLDEIVALFDRPFHDLIHQAQTVHRTNFDPNLIEGAMLLSIKTGACPEDCAYCPQAARYNTNLKSEPLLPLDQIVEAAVHAKDAGATRFCMGAAWRNPNDRQVGQVATAIAAVRELGLETCATLGMLTSAQAVALSDAGLDYYNHNLDTDPEFYTTIISTRTYQDRLDTLGAVRAADIKVCCGGIVGMGETRRVRAGLVHQLAVLDPHPESVPVNLLVQVPGTPLHGTTPLDGLELVRTIAAARITMPRSIVRLSAGRTAMTDELQTLCLHAGANSIFLGDKLLTTANAGEDHDHALLERLNVSLAVSPIQARSDLSPDLM